MTSKVRHSYGLQYLIVLLLHHRRSSINQAGTSCKAQGHPSHLVNVITLDLAEFTEAPFVLRL